MLMLQAVLVYGIGLHIVLPVRQLAPLSIALANRFQEEWPHVRRSLTKSMTPLMQEEVKRLVSDIRISVGGTAIAPPPSLQVQLANAIDRLLNANLHRDLGNRSDLAQTLTPTLIQETLSHSLVVRFWVRVDSIPVPCILTIGGKATS